MLFQSTSLIAILLNCFSILVIIKLFLSIKTSKWSLLKLCNSIQSKKEKKFEHNSVPNLPIDGPWWVFRWGAVQRIVSFLFDIFHDVEFSIFSEAEYYVVLIFICKMWQVSAAWLFITTLISNWPGSTTTTSTSSSSNGLLNVFGIMT
jgi:hypothetical protein